MDRILRNIAPHVLRVGLSLVFFWFGYKQLTNQAMWVGFVPDFVLSLTGMEATTIVFLNGIFEVTMATLLLFGAYVRIVTTLLALHMLTLVLSIGPTPTGVRDFGIFVALAYIALSGEKLK